MEDAFLSGLQSGILDEPELPAPWCFNSDDLRAIYLTTPRAEAHLADIAHLQPEPLGLTEEGFLRLRVRLPGLHSPPPRNI